MVDAARVGGSTPSFRHSLSLIGQFLNAQRARGVTIAEVDTGFLLFFFPGGNWHKQRSLAFHHADLLELNGDCAPMAEGRKGGHLRGGDTRDKKHPLCPQGYDAFLSAVAYKLDRRTATGVVVSETAEKLYLNYWLDKATFVIRDQRRQPVSNQQLETFDKAGVARVINGVRETLDLESTRHEHSLNINPHDHISTLAVAYLFEDQGNYREAENLFARVAAQVPNHPEVHYHLARLAYIRGDYRGASAAVSIAVRIRDDLAAVHDLQGRILHRQKKSKDAVAALHRALLIEPEHGLFHYHLAKIYESMGQREAAAEEMARSSSPHAAPAIEILEELASQAPPPAAPRRASSGMLLQADSPSSTALLPPLPSDSPSSTALLPPLPGELPAAPAMATQDAQPASVAATMLPQAAPATPAAADSGVFRVNWDVTVAKSERTVEPGLPQADPLAAPAPGPLPAAPPPSLTTFDTLPALWPQAPAQPQPPAQAEPVAPLAPGGVDLPQLTPLAATAPVTPDPIPVQPAAALAQQQEAFPPTMSLEQRLRTAGAPPTAAPAPAPSAPSLTPVPGSLPTLDPATWSAAPVASPEAPAASPVPLPVPAGSAQPGATPALAAAPLIPQEAAASPTPAVEAPGSAVVELAAEILMIQRALETEPNRADLHRKLGFLLARQGKTAEAAAEFRKALQCSRTNL